MNVISITMNTYQVISEDEILPSLLASDSHRGGGIAIVISELGRQADSFDIDSKQCKRKSADAGQRKLQCDYRGGTETETIVRRLTPLECERLQGFPDRWTDIGEWVDSKGKKHKEADSPRYKALGNSIALPFWEWMAKRMVEQLGEENPTMGSLFSGIGGFELCYARAGAEPVWESEIEEFCIAVSKKHFGDSETGEEGDYEQYL